MKKVSFTLFLAVSFAFISKAQSGCWKAQGLGILSEEHIILDLSAVDDSVVWGLAVRSDISQPVIIRSVNGGNDWEVFDLDSLGGYGVSIVGFSDQMAWFAGHDDQGDGLVYQTTNGGGDWVLKHIIPGNAMNPSVPILKFADETKGYFLDIPSQKFGKTTGGGVNWSDTVITFLPNESWGPLSPENYLVVSEDTVMFGTGKRIWKSTDGGDTWTYIYPSFPGTNTITSIAFDENGYGFAISARNESAIGTFGYLDYTYLWKSEDLGGNWGLPATVNYPFICLEAVPGEEKTFIAVSGEGSFVYPQLQISWVSAYTMDGGDSWTLIDQDIPYHALSFSSINAGWVGTVGGFDYGDPSGLRPAVYKWDCTVNTETVLDAAPEISLWPNPFTDHLSLQSEKYSIDRVEFFNVQGKRLFSVPGSEIQESDLSFLPKGLYTLLIWTDAGVVAKKGVKL